MSLTDRVKQAEESRTEVQADTARKIALLKERMWELVSADDLARVMRTNPERARNEVRSACRTALKSAARDFEGSADNGDLVEHVVDAVFGYGILEELLADPSVTEVLVNGTSSIYFERRGMLFRFDKAFSDEEQIRALIDRIISPLGKRVDESSPTVDARLPQGHRVHAIIRPLSLVGPVLTIRKFTERPITLEEMESMGSIDAAMRDFLTWAVLMRKSIAVSGGTGSGKTTLLNALSCKIPFGERVVTIEDSAELRFLEHPHVVGLEARARNAEGVGEVTIRDLVTNALRMRPDRIVVGECRGAEALDMLQAMLTGHSGSLTTLHANSPAEVVPRLTTMVRYGADLPVDVIEANIAYAIDVVVQVSRGRDGSRYVSEIAEVSYNVESRRAGVARLFSREDGQDAGRWYAVPSWLADAERLGFADEGEVSRWRRATRCSA